MNLDEALNTYKSKGWMWTMVVVHGVEFTVFYYHVTADPDNGVDEVKEPQLIYHGSDEFLDFLNEPTEVKIFEVLQETEAYSTPMPRSYNG